MGRGWELNRAVCWAPKPPYCIGALNWLFLGFQPSHSLHWRVLARSPFCIPLHHTRAFWVQGSGVGARRDAEIQPPHCTGAGLRLGHGAGAGSDTGMAWKLVPTLTLDGSLELSLV